jgi:hypothetical protein
MHNCFSGNLFLVPPPHIFARRQSLPIAVCAQAAIKCEEAANWERKTNSVFWDFFFGCHSFRALFSKDRIKRHDFMFDQVADFFRTTHKVKTQHVVKNRGQYCGDIELAGYLANTVGPVTLVLDKE